MHVNKLTIRKVFDSTERLEAPLFQRPYVWDEARNWKPLLEAILHQAQIRLQGRQPRPHFLGTIVLEQIPKAIGRLPARQLIDGQQRLTTLQLAIAAARDACAEAGQSKASDAFRELTENRMSQSEHANDLFKVWPTNADRPDFNDVMRAGSVVAVQALPHANPDDDHRIPDAYLYFHRAWAAWLKEGEGASAADRVNALFSAIAEDLQVVAIDLEKEDDGQAIFETLNALGTPLLPVDLVKNYLFRSAEAQKEPAEELYGRYWETFELRQAYWREEIRQGRLKRPRIDLFLAHYLTLLTGEDVLASELFASYRHLVESSGRPAREHMAQFREYADVYEKFDSYPQDARAGLFFRRLQELDSSTAYPLLLEVLRRWDKPNRRADLEQILGDLESFIIRRSICRLTNKHYNKFFVQLARDLRDKPEADGAQLRNQLLAQTADTTRWPDDGEFRRAWCALQFYDEFRQGRVRMMLEALESALISPKSERVRFDEKLSIEHVMPQEWEEHWPLRPNGAQSPELLAETRAGLIHRIGNLTLVTRSLNPAVSNGPWRTKRVALKEHSRLQLNAPLSGLEDWDEAAICRRTLALYATAVRVWGHPKSKCPPLNPVIEYRDNLTSGEPDLALFQVESEADEPEVSTETGEALWKEDGRAWHMTRRCSPQQAKRLERLVAVLESSLPKQHEIHWGQKSYILITVHGGDWIWITPQKTQLVLNLGTPNKAFDWRAWAARLKVAVLESDDDRSWKATTPSSIQGQVRPEYMKLVLRIRDDFDFTNPSVGTLISAIAETLP